MKKIKPILYVAAGILAIIAVDVIRWLLVIVPIYVTFTKDRFPINLVIRERNPIKIESDPDLNNLITYKEYQFSLPNGTTTKEIGLAQNTLLEVKFPDNNRVEIIDFNKGPIYLTDPAPVPDVTREVRPVDEVPNRRGYPVRRRGED